MKPLLPALLILCLALPTQGADAPPRSVILEGYGVVERGQGPAGHGRWTGFPISVSLHKAPLEEVVRTFAKLAGFNLILDPRVQGSVTVELKDVPWDQALYMILKTHGMGAEIDGRLWAVAPR
jgi:type II secretory pathway component GspD/PulD (secretin)